MTTAKPIGLLYKEIEKFHGNQPWGSVLDAGTGSQSLNWILSLDTKNWTAITGAEGMAKSVMNLAGQQLRSQDRIIVGNWVDEKLLAGEQYDYVIADYLLGAIDGFAPYWQDLLFYRLRPLIRKRLYFIGLDPYIPYYPTDIAGQIIGEIGRLRDACLLMAGERPYREYPIDWVFRHLHRENYRIITSKKYNIRYGTKFIDSQLNMCVQRMHKIDNKTLANSMLDHIENLREKAHFLEKKHHGLAYGYDYIIVAEPI